MSIQQTSLEKRLFFRGTLKFLAGLLIVLSLLGASQLSKGRKLALWLTSLQDKNGAIPDVTGWDLCNLDSNMEYALLGIASAYWKFKDARFKRALRRGIIWLAEREEMEDTIWRGSWYYAYSCHPPYDHIPVSPENGVLDARGVDSTSALFLYLLWVYGDLSGDLSLWKDLRKNAEYALEFLLKARLQNGFFRSSWHLLQGEGWKPYDYNYTADQGDVYLGLWGAWKVLHSDTAKLEALRVEFSLWKLFDVKEGAYCIGVEGKQKDMEIGTPSGAFPQGYIPWVFGLSAENLLSLEWLRKHQEADGGFRIGEEKFRFALPAIVYIMGMKRLGFSSHPSVQSAEKWLLKLKCPSGGIRDNEAPSSPCFSNLTGLAATALLDFPPFSAGEGRFYRKW